MNHPTSFKKLLLPSLISICTLPLGVQNAAGEAALEEVIVTAQKRQSSLQETPIAVSALSAGQIERGALHNVLDVAKLVPNVEFHTVSQSGASLGASIRGVGFDDLEKAFEPTVGISVDGVFMASNSGAVVDFFDIASVEVLRGPQGTLYGRNTIAGVINIQRTKPTGEWGAKIETTVASHNWQDVKGIFNMPLGEKGGIKLGFRDLTSDSHLYNETIHDRPENRDSDVYSVAVKYDFTDNTSAVLSYDNYDHKTQPFDPISISEPGDPRSLCGLGLAGVPGLGFAKPNCKEFSGDLSKDSDYEKSYASEQILGYIEGENLTLNATHQTDNYTLKYIFGDMEFEELSVLDSWGGPAPFVKVVREQTYEQTSHELQYISDYEGAFNFVAGLYYLETDSFLTSGPGAVFSTTQEASAKAVFGEMTYELTELWTLTAGARYTEEEKNLNTILWNDGDDASRAANDLSTARVNLSPTFKDENVSYRLIIQRDLDIGMVFASFSTGYRSGGFNPRASAAEDVGPYASEEVENLEFGIRTQPTDYLQINATVFASEYTDKQQFVADSGPGCAPTCTFVRNAAETTNEGVEIEAVVLPTDNLTVRISYGYLDSEFDKYDFQGTDIADNAFVIYAPEHTASVSVDHASEVFGGNLMLNGTFSYRSEMFGATDFSSYNQVTGPDLVIDEHEQLDLSATYKKEAGIGMFKIQLYATDVLNSEGHISRKFDAGAFAWAELVPGREIGVTLGYEF